MRVFSVVVSFAFLVSFCFCSEKSHSLPIAVFADYNTDVLLLTKGSNFVLIGYGGSNHGSADCVIKSKGKIEKECLIGYLKSVNTAIVTYEVGDSLRYSFKACFTDTALNITSGDVADLCGMGTVFARKYARIVDPKILKKKIIDFWDLMQDSKGNEDLLPALKEALTQLKY